MLRNVTQYITNIAIFYTKNCLYKYREKKEKRKNKYRFYFKYHLLLPVQLDKCFKENKNDYRGYQHKIIIFNYVQEQS